MSDFYDAIPVDEMDPETAATVEVNGREVCIVYTNGEFYALQNDCTHAGFPMGEGDLTSEGLLECPGHASMFNIETGEPTGGPATEPLETYDVQVVDGVVRVAID